LAFGRNRSQKFLIGATHTGPYLTLHGRRDHQETIMSRFKLAAIAIAAATIATPALAQQTYRQPVQRSAVVTPAPMLGYAWEPAAVSLNTPNATGGGTFGYNQSLETPAN
jgi:hypothetical protein